MGRDMFGNGRRIDETLERFVFEKTALAPEKRLQMKKSTPKKKGQKKWDKGDIFFSLLVWVGFVKIQTQT